MFLRILIVTIFVTAALVAAVLFFNQPASVAAVSEPGEQHETQTDADAESHDEHGHDEHAHEEGAVALTAEQLAAMGVKTGEAAGGPIAVTLALPGEVRLNEDRTAHVVPRLTGVVREVYKSVGDVVRTGDVLAVMESRELADAKADYLAAGARLSLAQQLFRREEDLWAKRISAEQDYLQAKQSLEEAKISTRAAEQKIHALGLSESALKGIASEDETSLTRFAITAPFDGTIIQKHITLGEFIEANADCFLIADLSSVWVDVSVTKKDLAQVKPGQPVVVAGHDGIQPASAQVAFVAPIMGQETRTTVARIILPNPDGVWRPGLFVDAAIDVARKDAAVLINRKAVVAIEEKPHVFVNAEGKFSPRPVQTGTTTDTVVEITDGLKPGEIYASEGAYTLKAELEKSELAEEGHVH